MKRLTCTFHIDGQQVESLTKEQIEILCDRLSRTMSIYYTAHPDEYLRIQDHHEKGKGPGSFVGSKEG